ncbi:hypothetical protein Salat_0145600 [Sesamum alatum]|uniref:Uncharacterized protein n=1 Tax=Sesamum alatum TaxID=300844 RepID=A0AAE1YWX5_9LAMI|nr:hypothetical protein Salat_0145600 [Sesamum alatum]
MQRPPQYVSRPSFTQPRSSMQRPNFVPPRTGQFTSPFQVPPQPAQRPETTQPPSNNNPQGTLQPSQRPMQHAPRRRKQSAPVSKSAKMQKMAEGTGISFQRECCSSTRPILSSQLKRLSSSYRPDIGSSSSKGQDASGKKN